MVVASYSHHVNFRIQYETATSYEVLNERDLDNFNMWNSLRMFIRF